MTWRRSARLGTAAAALTIVVVAAAGCGGRARAAAAGDWADASCVLVPVGTGGARAAAWPACQDGSGACAATSDGYQPGPQCRGRFVFEVSGLDREQRTWFAAELADPRAVDARSCGRLEIAYDVWIEGRGLWTNAASRRLRGANVRSTAGPTALHCAYVSASATDDVIDLPSPGGTVRIVGRATVGGDAAPITLSVRGSHQSDNGERRP